MDRQGCRKGLQQACAQNNFNSAQDATAQKSVHQPAANRFSTPCDNTHVIGVRPAARWMYCLVKPCPTGL